MIPISKPDISRAERFLAMDAVASGWLTSGEYLDTFEEQYAAYCNRKYCVTTCNGTAALHLALIAMNMYPGAVVLVPNVTYVATAAAVKHAGWAPILHDRGTSPLDRIPEIAVSLYGEPGEWSPYSTLRIEDASEAPSRLMDGCCETHSFYANKFIACGEGGAITTDDEDIAKRARYYRGQCMDKRWDHSAVGYNYRWNNVAAAIGCAQLHRQPELLAKRQRIGEWYMECIERAIAAIPKHPWMVNVACWDRDAAAKRLAAEGIESRPYFQPLNEMLPYSGCEYHEGERDPMIDHGLSLPVYTEMTKDDVARVCEVLG